MYQYEEKLTTDISRFYLAINTQATFIQISVFNADPIDKTYVMFFYVYKKIYSLITK